MGCVKKPVAVIFFDDGIVRKHTIWDRFLIGRMISTRNQRDAIFIDYWEVGSSPLFGEDAKRSLRVENAGGHSVISEMMSIEYFSRVFRAQDVLLEMEVEYWIDYKMVDFICTISGVRVGISVTRAMGFPGPSDFTYERGLTLLKKKLYGLIVSRNGVTKKHSFFRSILHVWCQNRKIANFMKRAYQSFDIDDYGLNIKGVVILQLTVCKDPSLYTDCLPKEWNLLRGSI